MADYISVKDEFDADFSDLQYKYCWSGAIDTLEDIEAAGAEDEFMDHLSTVFFDEEPVALGELNDYIWFERDAIYEACGLNSNGKPKKDAEDIKADMDLSVTQITDEWVDVRDGRPFITVTLNDSNSDFEIDLDVYQDEDGTLEFDVMNYVIDDDGYFAELADDQEIIEMAGDLALDYLKANGKYDNKTNRLIVEE